jgi:hypothetical protein
MTTPPNNPFKRPLYWFGVAFGIVMILFGALIGPWWLVAPGVFALPISALGLWGIRGGRNPWWTRAPLDSFYVRRRGR